MGNQAKEKTDQGRKQSAPGPFPSRRVNVPANVGQQSSATRAPTPADLEELHRRLDRAAEDDRLQFANLERHRAWVAELKSDELDKELANRARRKDLTRPQAILRAILEFREYKAKLERTETHLYNNMSHELLRKLRSDDSRYYAQGRKKMQRNIKKRLGRRWQSPGVLVTLEYNPHEHNKTAAWCAFNTDTSRLLATLNKRRSRTAMCDCGWRGKWERGMKEGVDLCPECGRKVHRGQRLKCLHVVEEIPKFRKDKRGGEVLNKSYGYPHVHLFFPSLHYLLDKAELAELWGNGFVDVRYLDNVNVASYVCKYVAKLEGWREWSQAILWLQRKRTYGYSACYRLPEYDDGGHNYFADENGLMLPIWRFVGSMDPGIGSRPKDWVDLMDEARTLINQANHRAAAYYEPWMDA